MCSTYGEESCQMLRVGRGEGTDLEDVWKEVCDEDIVLENGIARARSVLLAKTNDDIRENSVASVSTISPSYNMASTHQNFEMSSVYPKLIARQRNVSLADRDTVKAFLQEFVDKNLVPFAERSMRSLLEQIGQRRGLPRSLTAGVRRWLGGNAPVQTAPVSYANESVEMQNRKLADLLLEFGLYEKAHQQYQAIKKEFLADNAILHHAAALDMSAYSYFLSNTYIAKNFPIHYFENAMTHFLANAVVYTLPLRCALQASEVLSRLERDVEAAMQLVRLTSLESDLCVAVCLLRAASAFDRATMDRKAAFYRSLAGHRFVKCDLIFLATECYRAAFTQYFEKNWTFAEDHIAQLLSRECSDVKLAFSCASSLLRPSPHYSSQQHADFLNNYSTVVKKFSLDAHEPIQFAIPLLNANATTIIRGELPRSETIMDAARSDGLFDGVHPWEDMQRAAFHSLAGPSAFHPLSIVANAFTDNVRRRETPAGERFRVIFTAENPLAVPLILNNVTVCIGDVVLTKKALPESLPFHEISLLPSIHLPPGEFTKFELWVRPNACTSHFRITDLLFEVEGVRSKIPLLLRGGRLNKTSEQLKKVIYAEDRRFEVNVASAKWPLLDVHIDKPLPGAVFCGQAVRIVLTLENIGEDFVSGVCLSSDGTDWISGGLLDERNCRMHCESHISANNANIRVVPLPGVVLAQQQSKSIFIDVRAPQQPCTTSVAILIFYRGTGGACREHRITIPLKCRPLLSANARLLDPIYGLLALCMRNEMTLQEAARVELLKISASLLQLDESGRLRDISESLSLRPVRLRSVQLDSIQSDSFCVTVSGRGFDEKTSRVFWLSSEVQDLPIFPLSLRVNRDCVTDISRPYLVISLFWKATIVNSHGHVTTLFGENLLEDPFSLCSQRIPRMPCFAPENVGELSGDAPSSQGVSISCAHVAPICHDFANKRLCEFPVELRVRNDDSRVCSVSFRLSPKIPLPLIPPLPADARQQWWINREEWRVSDIDPCSEATITLHVRVAQPTVYDLLGTHVQAVALFSDGSQSTLPVPAVHALVTDV